MELGFKFWFLIAGSLVLAGVLGHGLWLTWRARGQGTDDASAPTRRDSGDDPLDILSSQLPGDQASGASRKAASTGEQRQFDLDEPVPVLMETTAPSLRESAEAGPPAPDEHADESPAGRTEPSFAMEPAVTHELDDRNAQGAPEAAGQLPEMRAEAPAGRTATRRETTDDSSSPVASDRDLEPARDSGGPQEIVVVYVLARDEAGFAGSDVMRVVVEQGLTFGDMNIFHRYVGEESQYSMASAVEPGTFDPAVISESSLAGVVFFLPLPGPGTATAAFDHLIGVARELAARLSGDLRDEQQSVLTRAGIEHARERVRNFERRNRRA